MFCPNCGANNANGTGFCGQCGTSLGNVQQPGMQQPMRNPIGNRGVAFTPNPLADNDSPISSSHRSGAGAIIGTFIVIALIGLGVYLALYSCAVKKVDTAIDSAFGSIDRSIDRSYNRTIKSLERELNNSIRDYDRAMRDAERAINSINLNSFSF